MWTTARLHLFLMLCVIMPVLSGMANVSWGATPQASCGGNFTVVLRSDGSLWAWGANTFGQLGIGSNVARNAAVRIGTDTDWAAVSSGFFHNLALKSDGTLWSWGDNTKGQLGDGLVSFSRPVPVRVGSDTNWAAVSGGAFFSLALKTDGSLWAWGENSNGQVGDGSVQPTIQPAPVRIGTDTDWVAISADENHALALKSNRTLWAWGNNTAGQLGNGSHFDAFAPLQLIVPAPFINDDWVAVASGQLHSLALKADGTIRSWGNNTFGQLGDGTTLDSDVPVQEAGRATDWVAVADGDSHSLARKADGTLWAWGRNLDGQLGIGTNLDVNAPVRVGTDTDWVATDAGGTHTVALKANNTIWTWGDNSFGQLGDGTNISRNAPVQVLEARFFPRGDLDLNGAVDVADALRALRIAIGLVQPSADDLVAGDVAPPGGVIDIADALLILRSGVGLVSL